MQNPSRWQGCQMVYFQTKSPNLGKFWRVLYRKRLVHFTVLWSISLQFGILCGHLVNLTVIWYIFHVLVRCIEINLAALPRRKGDRFECNFGWLFSYLGMHAADKVLSWIILHKKFGFGNKVHLWLWRARRQWPPRSDGNKTCGRRWRPRVRIPARAYIRCKELIQ
jgi:hypothetical protein